MKKIVAILMAMMFVISVTVVLAGSAADKDTQPKVPVIIGFESTPGPADKAMVRGHGGDIKYSYTIINAIAAKLPEPAIENIPKSPRVTYVEMDGEVHTLDAELNDSWGVKRIGAGTVHDSGNNGSGVKVAILDTGIDYNHPDLDGNFDTKLLGYDFVNDDSDPMDDNGHGTHCAGIVAAEDDGAGVVGVAPGAHLYAVKVLDGGGSGSWSDLIAGIEWSVENETQVISMSLGGALDSQTLHDACDAAYDEGIIVVAAAGNDGNPPGRGDNVGYPARYDSVIAVAATDSNDNRARWSSTGPAVELAAPGVSVYSTIPGRYDTCSGTSMACPHVAGTAALVIVSGITDNGAVRTCLQKTAEDLGETGKDNLYGYGLVDAEAAAGSAVTLELIAVTPESASIPKGLTQQYTATGTYSDDSTADITSSVTWASSTAVATINSEGLATGVSDGITDITATLDSVVSNTATLTVTAPILQSITVMPDTATIEVGATQEYTATGTYSDDSTADITSSVTWASSTAVATIDSAGLATGVSDGITDITATLDSISDTAALTVTLALNSIAVTPESASIPKGLTQQYTATGTYSDDSTADITSSVTWASSTAVATINSEGLATGVGDGSTNITATLDSVGSNTATLTVTAPILQSITVMPDTATIEVGATQEYTATGTYSDDSTADITSSVTWASSTAVATIDSAGLATGVSDGITDITATLDSISDTAALTVTLALNSIAVTPAIATIPKGLTQQYTATGTYSDTSTADITSSVAWASSDTAVATIDSVGLATGVGDGSTNITATLDSVGSNTATLTVTAPSEPTAVIVKSISYSTEGGKNQDRHLCIAVALVDNLGNPVADASVSINVDLDESLYVSYTGTTGTDGTVTFKKNNAPSGTYTTAVTAVIAEGLIWDEVTPENSFTK